jgi:hypothetical protein
MTEEVKKSVEQIVSRNAELDVVISNLENNQGWLKLQEWIKADIEAFDSQWHLIEEFDVQRRQHLRSTKMSYVYLKNIIDDCKQELARNNQLIIELNSDSLTD